MESYNFEEASVETGSVYLKPGNHLVKVTEVKSGVSSQKQTPYVEVKVEGSDGSSCSQQYYLSTTVKEGGKTSAFKISAAALLQLVMAANNMDEASAKAKLAGITSPEALAQKLSAALVGKEFGIRIVGEWVNPQDTTKPSWVKGVFSSGKFAVAKGEIATLRAVDATLDVKGAKANSATNVAPQATAKAAW